MTFFPTQYGLLIQSGSFLVELIFKSLPVHVFVSKKNRFCLFDFAKEKKSILKYRKGVLNIYHVVEKARICPLVAFNKMKVWEFSFLLFIFVIWQNNRFRLTLIFL